MQSNRSLSFKNDLPFHFCFFLSQSHCAWCWVRKRISSKNIMYIGRKEELNWAILLESKLLNSLEIEFKCKVVSAEKSPDGLVVQNLA